MWYELAQWGVMAAMAIVLWRLHRRNCRIYDGVEDCIRSLCQTTDRKSVKKGGK